MAIPMMAIAGAGALIKGVTGLVQTLRARKLEKQNPFVTEQANSLLEQNAAQAKERSRSGLPQQQYRNAVNNIGKNQAGGVRALMRSANPGAGLASMIRAGNDASINLDIADANAVQGNQRFSMQQNQVLAQEQNRVWNWNKRERYMQKLAQSEAMKGAGMQNMMGAANDVVGMGMMGMAGKAAGGVGAINNQSQASAWSAANFNPKADFTTDSWTGKALKSYKHKSSFPQ